MSKKALKVPQSHEEICKIAASDFKLYALSSNNPSKHSVTYWCDGQSKVGAKGLNKLLKDKIYKAVGENTRFKVTVTSSKRAKDDTVTIRVEMKTSK